MNKLIMTTILGVFALCATTANARSNVSVGIGINEPVYAPAPVVYQPYVPPPIYQPAPAYYGPPAYYPSYYSGRERHRNYDWRYWHEREEEHRRAEWERDHRGPYRR